MSPFTCFLWGSEFPCANFTDAGGERIALCQVETSQSVRSNSNYIIGALKTDPLLARLPKPIRLLSALHWCAHQQATGCAMAGMCTEGNPKHPHLDPGCRILMPAASITQNSAGSVELIGSHRVGILCEEGWYSSTKYCDN